MPSRCPATRGSPRLNRILRTPGGPRVVTNQLYLEILNRWPTPEELQALQEYSAEGVARGREAGYDLAWALINSPEFLYRH